MPNQAQDPNDERRARVAARFIEPMAGTRLLLVQFLLPGERLRAFADFIGFAE
jgi:hypothetical protein